MPDDLEYMLADDVKQPRWIPRAYDDILRTYQFSSNQLPPYCLLIYHGDGDGNTIVYHFSLLEFYLDVERGDEFFITSNIKKHFTQSVVQGEPWKEETKNTLWEKCQDGFDAIHMDLDRDSDDELITHVSIFASLYFIHEFYDSVPGVEKADERVRMAPEGTTKLPTQPYGTELVPREPQENNVIPFPSRIHIVDDDSTSDD